jgi:hypothetical protein
MGMPAESRHLLLRAGWFLYVPEGNSERLKLSGVVPYQILRARLPASIVVRFTGCLVLLACSADVVGSVVQAQRRPVRACSWSAGMSWSRGPAHHL